MAYLKIIDFSSKEHFSTIYLPRVIRNGKALFYGELVKVAKTNEKREGKQVYTIIGYAF